MSFRKIIPVIPAHRCEPAHRGVPARRADTVTTTRPAPAQGGVIISRPARRVIGG